MCIIQMVPSAQERCVWVLILLKRKAFIHIGHVNVSSKSMTEYKKKSNANNNKISGLQQQHLACSKIARHDH